MCKDDERAPCALHAAMRHMAKLAAIFGDDLNPEMPFFPSLAGNHLKKEAVVDAYIDIGRRLGMEVRHENRAIGGHTPRVAGAQFLASIGVEIALIQLLARHDSDAILGYVKEAPLQALTATTKLKVQQKCRKHGQAPISDCVPVRASKQYT